MSSPLQQVSNDLETSIDSENEVLPTNRPVVRSQTAKTSSVSYPHVEPRVNPEFYQAEIADAWNVDIKNDLGASGGNLNS